MYPHPLAFMNSVLFWMHSNATHVLFRTSPHALLLCLICCLSTFFLRPQENVSYFTPSSSKYCCFETVLFQGSFGCNYRCFSLWNRCLSSAVSWTCYMHLTLSV
ncbi:uncharacterized protein DEA37_0008780 [Paragonimus westermani]|uniref:Uncharacterized protein n=1 Tax=Paragonimus westermani TaxID=34504 RepID=A0A5J4NWC7_9TREM|nr:uncharacterized protein DEA37_0008780 [Paragonimus westermani]